MEDAGSHGGRSGAPRVLARLSLAAAVLWLASLGLSLLPSQAASPLTYDLQVAFLLLFVVLHAAASTGWKGAAAFVGIVFAVALISEACNQLTGFPFGWVTHNLTGPRLFQVPLFVGLSYVTAAWPAWVMAKILVGPEVNGARRLRQVATAVVASLIVTGYDLAYDPVGATVLKLWTYRHPGGLLGVPLTNFVGWLLTSWAFFQLFALFEARSRAPRPPAGRAYWLLPSAVWIATVLANIPSWLSPPPGVVTAGDRTFVTADIFEAGLILGVVVMLLPALAAAFRVASATGWRTSSQHAAE